MLNKKNKSESLILSCYATFTLTYQKGETLEL